MSHGLSSDEDDKNEKVVMGGFRQAEKNSNKVNLEGLQNNRSDYVSGKYIGVDLKRSPKLN